MSSEARARAPTMVDFKQGRPKMADAVNMKLCESFVVNLF
jgi:hypothetical protein